MMPNVAGQQFPYTPKGRAAAEEKRNLLNRGAMGGPSNLSIAGNRQTPRASIPYTGMGMGNPLLGNANPANRGGPMFPGMFGGGYGQQRSGFEYTPQGGPNLLPSLTPPPLDIPTLPTRDNPYGLPEVPPFVLPNPGGGMTPGPSIPKVEPSLKPDWLPGGLGLWTDPNVPPGSDPERQLMDPDNFPNYPGRFGGLHLWI